ncbi:MAG: Do family serine endopeptidase [Prolixibacteraceae bacterium]|nr:Do family serine endopeptidase [Prolixibacteraceae bacterium]
MKNLKKISLFVLIALGSAFFALWTYTRYFNEQEIVIKEKTPSQYTSLPSAPQGKAPDLTYAAENSVQSVVHVMVTSKEEIDVSNNPFFDFFYGDRYPRQQSQVRKGAGSGVIISPDGYIVTNNHVVQNADDIKVILNDKREFKAKLIGTDKTTDVALIKIEEKGLPSLKFGNSDALKLGEWVLAVGNPFNLTSTVTAGIVSAKSRNIGINTAEMSIESFIQTDAAVNPGNSGGALVNMNGELVGINTAIASMTGSYSGYSFAIPSTIVKKVVADLKEYGHVQRAILGVSISEINAETAKKYDINEIKGVYIADVSDNSSATEAGIKKGDIILRVDSTLVNSPSKLQEQIGMHHPGDVVKIMIKRDHKTKLFNVTLRNMLGDTNIIKSGTDEFLGATFKDISKKEAFKLHINNGIKIARLDKGKLKDAGLKSGFIIIYVNKEEVKSIEDFERIVNHSSGGVLIEGIYPNGERAYFVFGAN